jgi:hypothetical protein
MDMVSSTPSRATEETAVTSTPPRTAPPALRPSGIVAGVLAAGAVTTAGVLAGVADVAAVGATGIVVIAAAAAGLFTIGGVTATAIVVAGGPPRVRGLRRRWSAAAVSFRIAGWLLPRRDRDVYGEEWQGWLFDLCEQGMPWHRRLAEVAHIMWAVPRMAVQSWVAVLRTAL